MLVFVLIDQLSRKHDQKVVDQYREDHGIKEDPWGNIERDYAKKLKDWIWRMRQADIHRIMTTGNYQQLRHTVMDELTGEPLWADRVRDLKDISKPFFVQAVDSVGDTLKGLFADLGISASFDIWDTRAVERLDYRVNKGSLKEVAETMRDQIRGTLRGSIEGGWSEQETADALKERFNIAQNRAPMIARTEIGGVINDSRIEGFKAEGFKQHEWLSSRDEKVRPLHQIDGEIVEIGQPFSNGLLYPNDPAGEPGNVINCRCLSLPVFEGAAVGEESVVVPQTKTGAERVDVEAVVKAAADAAAALVRDQMADTIKSLADRLAASEGRQPINLTMPKIDVMLDKSSKVELPPHKPSRKQITYERDKNGNPLRVFIEGDLGKQVMELEHDENGNLVRATLDNESADAIPVKVEDEDE
jgi:SPP1 gp7 family putative phage head morphogenesis protein